MTPGTCAELLAEYGPPSEIAASLALCGPDALQDIQLLLTDLRRFELTQDATETVSTIAGHLTLARRLMATLPALLVPAGEGA